MTASSRDFSLPAGMAPPAVGSAELATLLETLAADCRQAPGERPAGTADEDWMDVGTNGEARAVSGKQQGAPFVEAMMAPELTRTENMAATYGSSGSALVDFFFSVLPDTAPQDVQKALRRAWVEEPLSALQLAAHLRDVRDGKGERERFHDAAAWLAARHPATLLANLEGIAQAGYWKDLLMVVDRVCVGDGEVESRRAAAQKRLATKKLGGKRRKAAKRERSERWRSTLSAAPEERQAELKAQRAADVKAKDAARVADAARERRARRGAELDRARTRLRDLAYRALQFAVAALFARELKAELQRLREGKATSSLVAKWAPSPGNAYDRRTLLATTIAAMLFPASDLQRAGESAAHFSERTRAMLQKQYLTPLRAAAQLPEVAMSARAWDKIDYSRVASVCMKNNKKHFEFHDEDRFEEFLADVKSGKKTINAGALKPHELVEEAMQFTARSSTSKSSMETVEAQWAAYVAKLRESGTFSSALAIADVSGSMSGTPMNVAIALSLLLSELAAPPFNQLVCTFSARPQLHRVTGDTLAERVQDVARLEWGMNTDLDAVFELVLRKAQAASLAPEHMVRTLFIFSDMEFDEATRPNSYGLSPSFSTSSSYSDQPSAAQTNFQTAKARFEEHGYALPRIVFWNLRGSDRGDGRNASVPVTKREDGTALVSGFSGQLLKLFLANDLDKMTPESVMLDAIKGGKYDGWRVVD